jgi:hypothetical protein
MPDAGERLVHGFGIFTVSELPQSGIGIPVSGSVQYLWSCSRSALPSYGAMVSGVNFTEVFLKQ